MSTEIPCTQARLVRRSEATTPRDGGPRAALPRGGKGRVTLPRVGAKGPTKEQAA